MNDREIAFNLEMDQYERKMKERVINIVNGDLEQSNHVGLVSSETLIKLGLLNNTWLYIKRGTPPDCLKMTDREYPKMLLCFVAADNNVILEEGTAKISLEAAFNILFPDLMAFKDFQNGNRVQVSLLSLTRDIFSEPPVADKITISVIRSPFMSIIPEDYDHCLRSHFKCQRHLVLSQVFAVPYETKEATTSKNKNQTMCLWFKVTDLQHDKSLADSAWVIADETMMSEAGSLNAFVPFPNSEIVKISRNKATSGLQEQYELLINLCKPILKNMASFPEVSFLLHGPPAAGKRCLAMLVSDYFHLNFYEVNCCDFIGESLAAMEQRVSNLFNKAKYFSPCLLLLRNFQAFSKGKDDDEDEPRLIQCLSTHLQALTPEDRIITVATTNCLGNISSTVTRLFTYHVEIGPLEEEARLRLLHSLLLLETGSYDITCKKTAGMVLGDFHTLMSEALNRATKRAQFQQDENINVTQEDIDEALDKVHAEYKDILGMPDIPQVSWSDVGGLASVKAELIDTIKLPMEYPELVSKGLRRSGLLLYGPPGCGKTLLAKAVATEFALNFFSVKGPELMNMYVGQSEQNIRDMFRKARESSPCIIFFDELDSIAPNRGRSGDSGGVMDRIVSQLLAELDGLQSSTDLFVIGATNRPDLLDSALLRPGRFDKMVYVGFPETKEDRLNIMKAYTNKMRLSLDINVDHIENALPLNLTGADFYALCSDAYLNGIRRCIESDAQNSLEEANDFPCEEGILVHMCDFEGAMKELIPSVSAEDVWKYKEIKRKIDNETQSRK